jgi:uncharacterized membrane protein (UPF0127 family)
MPHKTVRNQTRNTLLVENLEIADNLWTRFLGLMGRQNLPEGQGLWIEPCADIHSCFMRFLFDAVFVDKNGTVLHLVESMPAWRCSKWVKGGRSVLELPAGTIAKTNTQLGDTIVIESNE